MKQFESRVYNLRSAAGQKFVNGLAIGGILLALAGCSAPSDLHSQESQPAAPLSSDTTPRSPSSGALASSDPTNTSPLPSTAPPGQNAESTSGSSPCITGRLSGAIAEFGDGPTGSGDGAGHDRLAVRLTNRGSTPCRMQGWPGVSFVGYGDGTQVGAPARLDRNTAHPSLTLRPGGSAQAPIAIAAPAVFDPKQCAATAADGLRVYPPGSRTSLYIADHRDVCSSTTIDQMAVGAFAPSR